METFEFLVTSTAMVTLQEHIKIQAQDLDDAIAKIKDRDYYEEDGEIIGKEYEIIDYDEVHEIADWKDVVKSKPKFLESLWTSEY